MWDYTDKVKEHFLNPHNVGVIDDADGTGEVGSLACGDALKITFKLDNSGKIKDAKFQTFGCASAIASSSALTDMLIGKTIKEAEKITNDDIASYLGGLPKEKMHCSVMGRDALNKAIMCYRGEKDEINDEDKFLCECFEVTEKDFDRSIKEIKFKTLEDITNHLKVGGNCGKCHDKIRQKMKELNENYFIRGNDKLTMVQKVKMIDAALEKDIKPALNKDGGDIELIDVNDNIVYVKLKGACASCSKSKGTLKHYVETKLRELVMQDLIVEEA